MEAERLRLEAWSSCAWFFDSPDRIETIQVLVQAQAAADMFAELTGTAVGPWFAKQVRAAGVTTTQPSRVFDGGQEGAAGRCCVVQIDHQTQSCADTLPAPAQTRPP